MTPARRAKRIAAIFTALAAVAVSAVSRGQPPQPAPSRLARSAPLFAAPVPQGWPRRLPEAVAEREAPQVALAPDARRLPPPLHEEEAERIEAPARRLPLGSAASSASPRVDWWSDHALRPLWSERQPVPISINELALAALEHSERIQALRCEPHIWQADVDAERAAFDVAAFVDSRLSDLSEPVGNTLATGGPPRLDDFQWRTTSGFRRRLATGGTWELSQRIGLQDTNSIYFVPANQSQTRFSISFTQPLLRGRGELYNTGLIVLAEGNVSIASAQSARQIQTHLCNLAAAYWRLRLERDLVIQRRRQVAWAAALATELDRRRELDLLENQAMRARAAVASRTAALARAEAAVRNQEVEIHRLTGAWGADEGACLELIPQEPPAAERLPYCRQAALELALRHRAEIYESMERLRQAQVRLQLSCNELRPTLNLVLESYLSGLEGNYGVGRSLSEQFTEGAPSYTAGLLFEAPFGNRAAVANHRRRELEARKLTHELRATLQDITAEVDTALRNAQTAWVELGAKAEAVQATDAELCYLEGRWRALPGADRAASFLLTEMLDAQDRLLSAEADFASAQAAYAVSLVELKRVTGQTLSVANP